MSSFCTRCLKEEMGISYGDKAYGEWWNGHEIGGFCEGRACAKKQKLRGDRSV